MEELISKVQPFIIEGFQLYKLKDKESNLFYVVVELLELLNDNKRKHLKEEKSELLKKKMLTKIIRENING
jgi:hypothetical protein